MPDIHKVRLTIEPDREIEVSGRELRNLRAQGLVATPEQVPSGRATAPPVTATDEPVEEPAPVEKPAVAQRKPRIPTVTPTPEKEA